MSLLMKILLIVLAILCLPLGIVYPIFFLVAAVIVVLLIADKKKKKEPEPQNEEIPQVQISVSSNNNKKTRTFDFAVAGVTFKNDDGMSRQKILKEIDEEDGSPLVELEEYEFKNERAVAVYLDGEMIGNIARDDLQMFFDYERKYQRDWIDCEIYGGDIDEDTGRKKNYGCRVTIQYIETE